MNENHLDHITTAYNLGITQRKLAKILHGDFTGSLYEFLELITKINKVPVIDFMQIKEYLKLNK